jgi:hypothetical protein
MKSVSSLGADEPAYEPPDAVMESVLALGRSESRLKKLRNVVAASLTFDSFNDAPAGVRQNDAVSRQMSFEADDVEIALWLRRSEDRALVITGQVLRKSSGPIQDGSASVDLIVQGDHVRTSPLSAWGEFIFLDLPQTEYGLLVSFDDRVLRIPSLPVIGGEENE